MNNHNTEREALIKKLIAVEISSIYDHALGARDALNDIIAKLEAGLKK